MASRGDRLLYGVRGTAAVQQPHNTPGFTRFEPIQFVAGHHAGFAARTAGQIYFKAILLTGAGWRQWHEAPVILGLVGQLVLVMQLREALHRRQFLLLRETLLQQGKWPLSGRRCRRVVWHLEACGLY